jgi:transcriptional regulator with XRE-family HTH domain
MRQNDAPAAPNAFKVLRLQLGISQETAAKALGLRQCRISVIEANTNQPNFGYIQRLVQWALEDGRDVDVDALFGE